MQKSVEEVWIKAWFDGDYSEVAGTKKQVTTDKEEVGIQVLRGKLTALEVLETPPKFASNASILRQDLIQQVNIHADDSTAWTTTLYDVHIVEWEEDSTSGVLTGQGRRVGRIVGWVYGKLRKEHPAPPIPQLGVSSYEIADQIAASSIAEPQAKPVSLALAQPPIRCWLCHWLMPLILGSIIWFFCTWWWSLLTALPLVVRCLLLRQKLNFFTPPQKVSLFEPVLIMAVAFGALGVVIWTVFESCIETPILALITLGFLVVLSTRLRQCGLIWLVTAFWFMAMLLTCTGQDYDCLDVNKNIPNPISNLPSISGPDISKLSVPNLNLPTLPSLSGGNNQPSGAGEVQSQNSAEIPSQNPLQGQTQSNQSLGENSSLGREKQPGLQTQDQLPQTAPQPLQAQRPEVTGEDGRSLSKQDHQNPKASTAQATPDTQQREATAQQKAPQSSDSSTAIKRSNDQSPVVLPQRVIEAYEPELIEKMFRDKFPHWRELNEVEREVARKSVIRDLENSGVQRQRTPTQIGLELPGKLLQRFGDLWQDFQESLDRSFKPDREANEMAGVKTPTDSWNRISMDEAEKSAEQVFHCKSRDPGSDLNQVIYLGEGTLFDLNQAALSAEADVPLVRLSRLINRYPDSNIMVIGHADKTPHRDGTIGNLLLSEQRAQAVVDRLIEVGNVIPNRIMAFGAGDRYPILDTPEPFRGNRRVEVHIICPTPSS